MVSTGQILPSRPAREKDTFFCVELDFVLGLSGSGMIRCDVST